MKKILLIIFSIIFLLINEFSINYLLNFELNINQINKIRVLNIFNLLTLSLIFIYFKPFQVLSLSKKIIILLIYFLILDQTSTFFGFGYKNANYSSEIYRFPSPYDEFNGKSNVLDHNKYGFRGNEPNQSYKKSEIIISFFGGSTGYNGNPSIIKILSKKLSDNNISNIPLNFSSVSSNHNQHLHRLVKFSDFKHDIIIFYGGANEFLQPINHDPRPGYPYNFFVRENLSYLKKFFIKNSGFIGEFDKRTKFLTGQKKLLDNHKKKYEEWLEDLYQNYVYTTNTTKKISTILNPNACEKTSFFAFIQPMNPISSEEKITTNFIKEKFRKNELVNIYNLMNLSEKLKFIDSAHINQYSKTIVAEEIYKIIHNYILQNC